MHVENKIRQKHGRCNITSILAICVIQPFNNKFSASVGVQRCVRQLIQLLFQLNRILGVTQLKVDRTKENFKK